MHKNYRYDIQGLRAIAVLSIVIFHINPGLLPGGYLGVDVFFVISGYLIIGQIWKKLQNDEFVLVDFYKNRVKRLFPALFLMVIISIIIGYFTFTPNETTDFHKSVISTIFYVSNFYFYSVTNYFNTSIHYAPLLHTWSLSVEEQFYLLFPFLLMLLFKVRTKLKLILFTTFIAFFILSIFAVYYDESLAFYASPSRFFQFLAGGILSIVNFKNDFSRKVNTVLMMTGLIVVALCLKIYDSSTTFPGLNALLPTMATALIIYSSNKSNSFKYILTNKVFQVIGNSSYSIYLWHWPIIVYYKLIFGKPEKFEQISLLLISIFIGYLSWLLIENTTRYRKYKFNPLITSLASSVVLSAVMLLTLDGMKGRFNSEELHIAGYMEQNTGTYRVGTCFITSSFDDVSYFDKDHCVKFENSKNNILLIGDSHAAMYFDELNKALDSNQTLTQVTASGCYPTIRYEGKKRCTDLVKYAYNDLIKKYRFNTIILSANWSENSTEQLYSTLNYLEKYTDKIIIIGKNINFNQSLPSFLVVHNAIEKKGYFTKDLISDFENTKYTEEKIKQIVNKYANNVSYISAFEPFCNSKGCNLLLDGKIPIVFDRDHLTREVVKNIIEKQLIDKLNK